MPVEHNFDLFEKALDTNSQKYTEIVEKPLKRFIGDRYALTATEDYMQEGPTSFSGPPKPRSQGNDGPLRKVDGDLERAILGARSDNVGRGGEVESTTTFNTTERGMVWKQVITLDYALIHEKGGTITINQGVEAALWRKWYESGKEYDAYKWMALAAREKSHFIIPPRPYIKPTLIDINPLVAEKASELITEFIERVLPGEV